MNLILGLFFIVFFAGNLIFTGRRHHVGDVLTKPFLVPLIVLFYVVNAPHVNLFLTAALLFGFLGDVLLLGDYKTFLKFGLAAFLVGNLLYALTFALQTPAQTWLQPLNYVLLVLYAVAGAALLRYLWKPLGEMRIPAALYLAVIFVMSWVSVLALASGNPHAWLSVVGSVLFILSDVILTYGTFVKPQKNFQPLVMFFYIAGQALLMGGFL